jgi:hexosaminidase
MITVSSIANVDTKKVFLSLENEFNPDIRYLIGIKITENAIRYTNPIEIAGTTLLKASLFKDDKPVGKIFIDTIKFHKAVASKLTFKKITSDSYKGDGSLSLVNIIRGTKNFTMDNGGLVKRRYGSGY